jgi:hypothetical protein
MSGFDSKREAAQNKQVDDGDYGGIDEVMHWLTIIILFLMTIVFLAGLAGFVWGSL